MPGRPAARATGKDAHGHARLCDAVEEAVVEVDRVALVRLKQVVKAHGQLLSVVLEQGLYRGVAVPVGVISAGRGRRCLVADPRERPSFAEVEEALARLAA